MNDFVSVAQDIGHQLQILRKLHLVQQHRHGKVIIYQLENPQLMTLVADVLSHADEIMNKPATEK